MQFPFMNINYILVGKKAKATIIHINFNTLYCRVSLEALFVAQDFIKNCCS